MASQAEGEVLFVSGGQGNSTEMGACRSHVACVRPLGCLSWEMCLEL